MRLVWSILEVKALFNLFQLLFLAAIFYHFVLHADDSFANFNFYHLLFNQNSLMFLQMKQLQQV